MFIEMIQAKYSRRSDAKNRINIFSASVSKGPIAVARSVCERLGCVTRSKPTEHLKFDCNKKNIGTRPGSTDERPTNRVGGTNGNLQSAKRAHFDSAVWIKRPIYRRTGGLETARFGDTDNKSECMALCVGECLWNLRSTPHKIAAL